LATDFLWSPGGSTKFTRTRKDHIRPSALLVLELSLMFSLCWLNCSRKPGG
jgi:hypothetical protein